MYSKAWEAKSNPSNLHHCRFYNDPVTLEHTDNRDAVNQHNDNSECKCKYNNASDTNAKSPRSDTHSNQDHVLSPKIDLRNDIEAPIENGDTSKSRHESNIRLDTDSTKSMKTNIPTNQTNEAIQA